MAMQIHGNNEHSGIGCVESKGKQADGFIIDDVDIRYLSGSHILKTGADGGG